MLYRLGFSPLKIITRANAVSHDIFCSVTGYKSYLLYLHKRVVPIPCDHIFCTSRSFALKSVTRNGGDGVGEGLAEPLISEMFG